MNIGIDYAGLNDTAKAYQGGTTAKSTQYSDKKNTKQNGKADTYEHTITPEELAQAAKEKEEQAAKEEQALRVQKKRTETSQPELSEAAKKLLEKLQKKFSNTDFVIANYSSDQEAERLLSRTTKEYGVLLEPEILEQMAADEGVRAKYENMITQAQDSFKDIASQIEDQGGQVQSLGMSIDQNGIASFFANIAASNQKYASVRVKNLKANQKKAAERLEAQKTKKKEQTKKAQEQAEKHRTEANKEETVRLKADSAEDLIKQINQYLNSQTEDVASNYPSIDLKL